MADEDGRRRILSLLDASSDEELLRAIALCEMVFLQMITIFMTICLDLALPNGTPNTTSAQEHTRSCVETGGDAAICPSESQGGENTGQTSRPNHQGPQSHPESARELSSSSYQHTRYMSVLYYRIDRHGRAMIPIVLSLSRCTALGNVRLVRLALDNGSSAKYSDPQTRETALHVAARHGHVEVVQLLLERGAEMDASDANLQTPLHTAAENGHVTVVRLLLQRGIDVNARGLNEKTPLHWAAQNGHVSVVRMLVGEGADMEIRMKELNHPEIPHPGGRALHLAVGRGHMATVRALLDIGAEVDGEDRWDRITALSIAATLGNIDIVELLCQRGANPNGADGCKTPPLISASSRGLDRIAQLLLNNGADIKANDSDGDPALHSAAYCGHLSTVILLLDSGADGNARGAGGRTARWWAAQHGHDAIVRLLQERGANDDIPKDMVNDSHVSLDKISNGDILRHVEQAQQLMLHESAFISWAENLLFVVDPAPEKHSDFDLDLIQTHLDSEEEPYIAVSYCWSGHQEASSVRPLRIRIQDKDAPCGFRIREVRAASRVLRRSMDFARVKGVKRIWIDQECIDQDVASDKQRAMQAMHLVYQRAAHTLVLLDCHIHTAKDIRALPDILRSLKHNDLVDRIFGDKWFHRAWTSQEWTNSRLQNLSYLVGWRDDLDLFGIGWRQAADTSNHGAGKPLQHVFRAWEFSHDQIFSMASMSMRHTDVTESLHISSFMGIHSVQKGFTLLDTDNQEMRLLCDSADIQSLPSVEYKPLRMTIRMAYFTLLNKRNLLVSDRLAILSNLAHYAYRINTLEVVQKELSFSASIIATALSNGDLSILSFKPHTSWDETSGSGKQNQKLSWAPLSGNSLASYLRTFEASMHTKLRNRIRSGDPSFVIDRKLMVRGIFWDIAPFSAINDLKDMVEKHLIEAQRFTKEDTSNLTEGGHILLQLLAKRLLLLERRDILELIVVSAIPRQLAHPSEIFDLLNDVEEWHRGERHWPRHLLEKSFLEPNHAGVRLERGRVNGPALLFTDTSLVPPYKKAEYLSGHPWGNQIIQWIYRAITRDMPLAVGQCEISDGEMLVSLFMLDPRIHYKVFTPLSELEYEFGDNAWIHTAPKANFWSVNCGDGKVDDVFIQKAREMLETFGLHGTGISRDTFTVQKTGDEVYGVWSPRLSRLGMLKQSVSLDWKMRSLGKAASYVWFD